VDRSGEPDGDELAARVRILATDEGGALVSAGEGEDRELSSASPDQSSEDVVLYRSGMTMDEVEREAIRAALAEVKGNRRKAAELLEIGERTLYRKIQKFGLS